jgi:hypothetical protein
MPAFLQTCAALSEPLLRDVRKLICKDVFKELLAGHGGKIVPTLSAQFIRDGIVSAAMIQLGGERIVQSVIAQFAGARIVIALQRQLI